MKAHFYFLFVVLGPLVWSCNNDEEKATGTVVFGANYHVIDCITNVNVFIDGKHVRTLEVFADSVPDCDYNYGIREELTVGRHSYKVEIRPDMGTGCMADVQGKLNIEEGGCETIFINYFEIDWN